MAEQAKRASEWGPDAVERDAYRAREQAASARSAAGMGFGRLVAIIATGIVVGLAVNDALRFVIVYLTHPPQ